MLNSLTSHKLTQPTVSTEKIPFTHITHYNTTLLSVKKVFNALASHKRMQHTVSNENAKFTHITLQHSSSVSEESVQSTYITKTCSTLSVMKMLNSHTSHTITQLFCQCGECSMHSHHTKNESLMSNSLILHKIMQHFINKETAQYTHVTQNNTQLPSIMRLFKTLMYLV